MTLGACAIMMSLEKHTPLPLVNWGGLNRSFSPGGPLECQGGYQARPKIHVIRVVFQDQALYARTSFRGAKTCKIGKKGVFLVIQTNFGKNMTGIKKNACKNAYLGSFFHT